MDVDVCVCGGVCVGGGRVCVCEERKREKNNILVRQG